MYDFILEYVKFNNNYKFFVCQQMSIESRLIIISHKKNIADETLILIIKKCVHMYVNDYVMWFVKQ